MSHPSVCKTHHVLLFPCCYAFTTVDFSLPVSYSTTVHPSKSGSEAVGCRSAPLYKVYSKCTMLCAAALLDIELGWNLICHFLMLSQRKYQNGLDNSVTGIGV